MMHALFVWLRVFNRFVPILILAEIIVELIIAQYLAQYHCHKGNLSALYNTFSKGKMKWPKQGWNHSTSAYEADTLPLSHNSFSRKKHALFDVKPLASLQGSLYTFNGLSDMKNAFLK